MSGIFSAKILAALGALGRNFPLRAVRDVALFLSAFAATCAAIHRRMPQPILPEVTAKMRWFEQHKDEYDTLFIGTSRVYHGLIAADFDSITQSHGLQTRSFNFGIDAMFVPEMYYVLEHIVALRPRALRRVIIEITPILRKIDHPEAPTERDVYWHDLPRTLQIFRDALESASKDSHIHYFRWGVWRKAWPSISLHAGLFFRKYSNLGASAQLFRMRKRDRWIERLARDAGENQGSMTLEKKEMSPAEQKHFHDMMRAALAPRQTTKKTNSVLRDATLEAIACVRRAGAEPLFITTPWPDVARDYFPGWKNPPPFFPHTDPEKFPELFDEADRVDAGHVDGQGAKKFTRVFAEEFCRFELARRGK